MNKADTAQVPPDLNDNDSRFRCPSCRYSIGGGDAQACPECGFRLRTGYIGAWVIDSRVVFDRAALLFVIYFAIELVTLLGLLDILHIAARGGVATWDDLKLAFFRYFDLPVAGYMLPYWVWAFVCASAVVYGIRLKYRARRIASGGQVGEEKEFALVWKKLFGLAVFVVAAKVFVMILHAAFYPI